MQDLTAFMQLNSHPQKFPEQERLKCPRCESTNTKFCYYNNYNLSQPRHYCKSCRRYWTKGGTLRNIPVGGGTRKSTAANTTKRSASSVSERRSPSPHTPTPLTQNPNTKPGQDAGSGSYLGCVADDQPGENRMVMDVPGSFVSLFGTSPPQYGSLMMVGLDSSESGVRIGECVDVITGPGQGQGFGVVGRKMGLELELQGNSSGNGGGRGFLGNLQVGDPIPIYWGRWDGHGYGHDDRNGNEDGNGWTNLAI